METKPIAECKTLQELFADPSRWTQDSNARNPQGFPSYCLGQESVCFCLIGGTRRVYGWTADSILSKIYEGIEDSSIARFNDAPERKVEEIQALVAKLNI